MNDREILFREFITPTQEKRYKELRKWMKINLKEYNIRSEILFRSFNEKHYIHNPVGLFFEKNWRTDYERV